MRPLVIDSFAGGGGASEPMRYGSVCSGKDQSMLTRHMRDLTGHRNGRLVALKAVGRRPDGRVLWLCRCDCGGEATVQANNLTREAGTKSCGCLRREAANARILRDGAWNEGKSYAVEGGEKCYRTRHSWAKAARRHFGDRCQRCGWDEARCDVHHRDAKAGGGKHTLSNAIVLCPNCHRVEHEGRRCRP